METTEITPYVWRILLIDDDEDDYFLTRELLAAARKGKFILEWVPSYAAGKKALQSDTYDAVLIDYDLGVQTGTNLIRDTIALGCNSPLILLTGRGNYEIDVEAMEAGASDYLSKGEVNSSLLERSIRYAIDRKRVEDKLLKANEELHQERSRLNAIIENAPSGIVQTDRDGNFILANPAVKHIFNGELSGTADGPDGRYTLHHPDGSPFAPEELPLAQALHNGASSQNVEMLVRQDDGREALLLLNSSPLYDQLGNITGSVGVMADVTQLRKLEHQQLETMAQMEVQRRLMQHREMERMEIARDLHDGPIQEMLAINITLAEVTESTTDGAVRSKTQAIREKLQEQVSELRLFCHELRPPTLAPFGLEKAIRSHINTFEERYPEMDVRLHLEPDGKTLPEDTRMAMFRIYQEMMHNISKHAQAKSVTISLEVDSDTVVLEIEDDGVGFDVPTNWIEQARSGHLGLIGMRERAEAIGGKLNIRSSLGKGTRAQISVPISDQNDNNEGEMALGDDISPES